MGALQQAAAVGLCTGLLVARGGISSLVTTLGVSSVLIGLLSWYTNGESVLGTFPDQFIAISFFENLKNQKINTPINKR